MNQQQSRQEINGGTYQFIVLHFIAGVISSRTNSLSSLALCRFRAALGHTQQDRTYLTQQDISLSTRSIHHISSLLGLLTLQPGAYLYYQEDTVLIQDLEITQFETTCSSIHSITLLIRDYDISGSIIGGTQYLFKTQRL